MSPEAPITAIGPPLIRHGFTAFGGSACVVLAFDADEADVSDVVAEVYSFEAQLTRFDPRSELSRFNANAGVRLEVSPLLEALLLASLRAHEISQGLVNAGIHNALLAAGYDRSIEKLRRGDAGTGLDPALPRSSGWSRPVPYLADILEVGDGHARLAPGHSIDLGGLGKGWLADRLGERFDNACVNLGGDLRALGEGPEGRGWLVGLCDGGALRVKDGGVATSGTRGRSWAGGHHLIDPRTGRPASCEATAVSVAGVDAFTAEVLAKSAVLVGPAGAAAWLGQHGAVAHAAIWPGAPRLAS
jgi:FAD:protein FMN transferase